MQNSPAKKRNVLEHVTKGEKASLVIVLVLFVFGIGLDVADQPVYEAWKGWALIGLGVIFFAGAVPGIGRCAAQGPKTIWPVVQGAFVLLLIFLAVFYTSFHWISVEALSKKIVISDRFLNFPPMVVAIWAAGVGWYIHFQASAKNHRTNNAFALLMQTRTSTAFLERAHQVQKWYPHGTVVPAQDVDLFSTTTLRDLKAQLRNIDHPDGVLVSRVPGATSPDTEEANADRERIRQRLAQAEAADALKYLLNYYEFMAVGIAASDLDEELLYQTIGVSVTSVYHRARPFIEYIRWTVESAQPLAFTALEDLVKRWDERLADDNHERKKMTPG